MPRHTRRGARLLCGGLSKRGQRKNELEVLAESLRDHDRRVAEVEAKLLEAYKQVAEVASNVDVRTSLSTAGMAAGDFNLLEAESRSVQQAAEKATSSPVVGHRPGGTAEVVANMVAESRRATQVTDGQAVQAFEKMQMLWADVELGPISDDESVASSEAGEVPDARRKRKKEDAAAKKAKFKRMGELLQVSSKSCK